MLQRIKQAMFKQQQQEQKPPLLLLPPGPQLNNEVVLAYDTLVTSLKTGFKTTDYRLWLQDVTTVATYHNYLWGRGEELSKVDLPFAVFVRGVKPSVIAWARNMFELHPLVSRTKAAGEIKCTILALFDSCDSLVGITSRAFTETVAPEIFVLSQARISQLPLEDFGDRGVTEDEFYLLHQLVYGFWLWYFAEAKKILHVEDKEEEIEAFD